MRIELPLALFPLLASCAAEAPPEIRNLIVITADTLRADHLRTYGYHRDTAPHLDALARESLVFERCLASVPRTTPSHLSLMTGLHPYEHGVPSNFGALPDWVKRYKAFRSGGGVQTFAEAVNAELHTAGFVSATPVKRETGLASGFETWSEPEGPRRSGAETNREVLAWLQEAPDGFFLWVHYMDAHGPYLIGDHPSAPYDELFRTDAELELRLRERDFPESYSGHQAEQEVPAEVINLYDGAIRQLDDAVGELVDALRDSDLLDRSLLVFLADHGQGLGQHGVGGHGDVWFEQLHVPLFVRVPGGEVGRVPLLVAVIDVLPTALALAPELPRGGFLDRCRGVDALGGFAEQRPVFGMGASNDRAHSLTQGDWRLISRPDQAPALFDLASDPFELQDVAADHPERTAHMEKELSRIIRVQKRSRRLSDADDDLPPPDPARLRELRALGYTGEDE